MREIMKFGFTEDEARVIDTKAGKWALEAVKFVDYLCNEREGKQPILDATLFICEGFMKGRHKIGFNRQVRVCQQLGFNIPVGVVKRSEFFKYISGVREAIIYFLSGKEQAILKLDVDPLPEKEEFDDCLVYLCKKGLDRKSSINLMQKAKTYSAKYIIDNPPRYSFDAIMVVMEGILRGRHFTGWKRIRMALESLGIKVPLFIVTRTQMVEFLEGLREFMFIKKGENDGSI